MEATSINPSVNVLSQMKNALVSRCSRKTSCPHDDLNQRASELNDATRKYRRPSLLRRYSRDCSDSTGLVSWNGATKSPASMDCLIESPPIMFHGTPEESTGALLSGLVYFDVVDDTVKVDTFSASLSMEVTYKRPYKRSCSSCCCQITELKSWPLLSHPTQLHAGRHEFRFSTFMEGHLPASMDSSTVSVSYQLTVKAMMSCSPDSPSEPLEFKRSISVKRSLYEPAESRQALYNFPAANVQTIAHFTQVIRPGENNQVLLRLTGLMRHNESVKTVDLWRLRRVDWKLEESIKTAAPACAAHDSPRASRREPKTETRLLGKMWLHEGWTSNYSLGSDGTTDVQLDYSTNLIKAVADGAKYACDIAVPEGTEVTHTLYIDLTVSKEYAPENEIDQSVSTGIGRILHLQLPVNLSEDAGLGESWESEAAPAYSNLPPSPPRYCSDQPPGYDNMDEEKEEDEQGYPQAPVDQGDGNHAEES